MKRFAPLLLIFCLKAHAYIENRGLFPVGDSEALMANAGVALPGSAGAAILNPAGLARLKQRKLSLSGNTYMNYRSDLRPLAEFDGRDLDFKLSGFQAVPSSLISTWDLGSWTLAFAVVVPELIRSGSVSSYSTTNYDVQLTQTTDNQLMLVGFHMGRPFESFDWGFGCSVGHTTSNSNVSLVANPKASSGLTTAVLSTSFRRLDVKNLLCHTGVQKDFSSNLRWGLSLRLPTQHFSGEGESFSFTQSNAGVRETKSNSGKSARVDFPLDISFGLAITSLPRTTLLVDLGYQMRQSATQIEGVDSPTETKEAYRWNFGLRYDIQEHLSLLGGYAYNPGTTVLRSQGDLNEDYRAFSLGFESRQGQATLGLALFSAQSVGESVVSATRRSTLTSAATALVLTTGFLF